MDISPFNDTAGFFGISEKFIVRDGLELKDSQGLCSSLDPLCPQLAITRYPIII